MKNKKLEDLIDHYKKLIIYLQTSAYITAKFMTEKALGNKAPCIVSYSSILKFSGSKNGKVEKFPISKHNSYQVITDCIKNLLFGEHVSDFIVNINNHFTGLTADLFLFAHVTFPSFFCYFTFPEVLINCLKVVKSMISLKPHIACHFISSFYESYPMFLTSLFEKYDELTFSLDRKLTPMMAFHNLILSIQYACTFLTKEHFKLAQNCYATNEEFFSLTFIYTLLIPQLQIRNYDEMLIYTLTFVSKNKKSPSFLVLLGSFTKPKVTRQTFFEIYGSFSFFILFKIPSTYLSFFATLYEVKLLYEIIPNIDHEDYFNDIEMDGIIYENQLFNIFKMNDKMLIRNYKKNFIFDTPKMFDIVKKEGYEYCFKKLFLQSDCATNPYNYFMEHFASLKDDKDIEYRIYLLKKLANKYIKRLNEYEVAIAIYDCTQEIKKYIESSQQNLYKINPFFYERINIEGNFKSILAPYTSDKMNFWIFLNDPKNVPQDSVIYDNFVMYLINNQEKLYLGEETIQKLQIYMKNILNSNSNRVIFIEIPKFIFMLEKRFRVINDDEEFYLAMYNILVTILGECKHKFALYFFYFFKIERQLVSVPCDIMSGWQNLFNIFAKFVFSVNSSVKEELIKIFQFEEVTIQNFV